MDTNGSFAWDKPTVTEGDDWALFEQLLVQDRVQMAPSQRRLVQHEKKSVFLGMQRDTQWRTRSYVPSNEHFVVSELAVRNAPQPPHFANESHVVRIADLLTKGVVFVAGVNILSLVSWIIFAVPLINPFVSTLLLVCLPFFYWMGVRLRRIEGDSVKNKSRRGRHGQSSAVADTA